MKEFNVVFSFVAVGVGGSTGTAAHYPGEYDSGMHLPGGIASGASSKKKNK